MMDIWGAKEMGQLATRILVATRFYPMLAPRRLAQLIVAEAAQTSSGDHRRNVGGGPGDGQGYMQVTMQSVVKDLHDFGRPLLALGGSTVVTPDGNIVLGRLDQNVALSAWYTRNTVGSRQSLGERLLWRDLPYNHQPTPMMVVFGNAQLTWLAGPRHDRHTPEGAARFAKYHRRVLNYFVQSGFGDAATYEAAPNAPVWGGHPGWAKRRRNKPISCARLQIAQEGSGPGSNPAGLTLIVHMVIYRSHTGERAGADTNIGAQP